MVSEAERAAELFQRHRDELGFVNVAQCREKDLYVSTVEGEVVAAALGNHCVRKPQTTLYDIAVDETHRRNGHAESLVAEMFNDSPHEKMVAKCPVDLEANNFYAATGWELIDREDGKNRELNVWMYTND